jgi:ribosomal protein S6
LPSQANIRNNNDKKMIFHEINLLVSPNLSEADASSFVEKLEEGLQVYGKIVSDSKPERRKLEYSISEQNEAWLYFFNLYIEEEKDKKEILDLVEKNLKENKDILRFLFIKKDSKPKKVRAERLPRKESTEKTEEEPIKKEVDMEKIDKNLEEILGE